MNSSAASVDEYLSALPSDRKLALSRLRSLIQNTAPRAVESMQFGMPTYVMGEALFAFASQKNYMALYICDTEVVKMHRQGLKGLDCGKSCIRFQSLEQLPMGTIESMLVAVVKRLGQRREVASAGTYAPAAVRAKARARVTGSKKAASKTRPRART